MKKPGSIKYTFSSREEIDTAVEEFKNFESLDYESIKQKFYSLFGWNPIPVIWFRKEGMKELHVFRTRVANEVNHKDKISEFSFPPLDLQISIQRANWTGRNVFYSSDSAYTSLVETKMANEGNEFFIAEWGFNIESIEYDKIPITTLAIGNIGEENPWREVLMNKEKFHQHFAKSMPEKDAKLLAYLVDKLSHLFTDLEENKYPLSAFLADQRIYFKGDDEDKLMFPILIFPSVVNNLNSCNFAIHPFFTMQYMFLSKVIKVKVDETSTESINFSFTEIGIPTSGKKISWHKFEFHKENVKCQVLKLTCSCGFNFNLDNIDDIDFQHNGSGVTLEEIFGHLLKELDFSKLTQIGNPFEPAGILAANHVDVISKLEGFTATENDITHSDLTISFKVIQPITYAPI